MTISTFNNVINSMANKSKQVPFDFASGTTVAGYQYLLNRLISASTVGQQAIPTAYGSGGSSFDDTSLGYPTLPTPGVDEKLYLSLLTAVCTSIGNLQLLDHHWGCSGFSGIVTTAQTVVGAPTTTPRNTTGEGNLIFLTCYTATGSTAVTATITYVNESGVAGRTATVSIPASNPAGRVLQAKLQNGDFGVRSITSVILSATTGTAGNFGLSIMQPISSPIPMGTANLTTSFNFLHTGIPDINTDAAIAFILTASTTSSGILKGTLNLSRG